MYTRIVHKIIGGSTYSPNKKIYVVNYYELKSQCNRLEPILPKPRLLISATSAWRKEVTAYDWLPSPHFHSFVHVVAAAAAALNTLIMSPNLSKERHVDTHEAEEDPVVKIGSRSRGSYLCKPDC